MKLTLALSLLLLVAVPVLTWAAPAADFYSATTPVADYSEGERNKGIRAGLLSVLVKLTGSADIGARPAVRTMLDNARSYATEFGYVDVDPETGKPGLQVRYSTNELERFLRQNQLPVWPISRPPLLVWVVQEPFGQPQDYVARENNAGLYQHLDTLFEKRGMPVIYPVLDLEDQLALPIEAAWALQTETITQASARYNTDFWLLLRCYETAAHTWRIAWVMGEKEQVYLDNLDANSLNDALSAIGNGAVDRIVAAYAYVPSQRTGTLNLEVSGVNSFSAYSQLLDALKGMSQVRGVVVKAVKGSELFIELNLEGDEKPFLESLALNNQLILPTETSLTGQPLKLQWRQ